MIFLDFFLLILLNSPLSFQYFRVWKKTNTDNERLVEHSKRQDYKYKNKKQQQKRMV